MLHISTESKCNETNKQQKNTHTRLSLRQNARNTITHAKSVMKKRIGILMTEY